MRRAPTLSAGLAVRPGTAGPPTAYALVVLDAVESIPSGRVMTYADVAELTGRGTGRTVGTVLSRHGREVAWWRVVQASGRPAAPHLAEALRLLAEEGCPVEDGRVVLDRARWAGPGPGPGADPTTPSGPVGR